MDSMRGCVEHLSKDIGARPAGTDEEQQAAFYIKETYENETSLEVELEEFTCPIYGEAIKAALSFLVFLSIILAIATPSAVIASLIISLIAGVLFVLDELGIFNLGNYLGKAPSQNVIAKFISDPNLNNSKKSRKIVVLSNYDSAKVKAEYSGFFGKYLHFIKYFEIGGMALGVIGTLIVFMAGSSALVNILFVLGLVASALPICAFVMHKMAKFNDGANNNASSIAVMADVAKRLTSGVYSPTSPGAVVHGRQSALAERVIPEGAQVTWDEDVAPSEVNNFAGAKNNMEASSIVESMMFSNKRAQENVELDQVDKNGYAFQNDVDPYAQREQIMPDPQESLNFDKPTSQSDENVPSWFARGKQNAAKSVDSSEEGENENVSLNVKRSVFTTALDATEKAQREAKLAPVREEPAKPVKMVERVEPATPKETEVIEPEIAKPQEVLDKEVSISDEDLAANFRKANKEIAFRESHKSNFDVVPELKPLEAEEGIPVDEYYSLDNSSTKPLPIKKESVKEEKIQDLKPLVEKPKEVEASAVKQEAQVSVAPREERTQKFEPVVVKPNVEKREIKLPSLTGPISPVNKNVNEQRSKVKDGGKTQDSWQEQKVNNKTLSRDMLPSLEPEGKSKQVHSEGNKLLSNAGTFEVGEATGTFAPITDADLIRANEGESNLYVYDADDSVYQKETTSAGVVADEGYVDMPQTHAESIFGKLFHKDKKDKKADKSSLANSLGVDSSWNARKAGSELGTWDEYDNDSFNGGSVVVSPANEANSDESFSRGDSDFDQVREGLLNVPEDEGTRNDIYQFASGNISKDVWFVNLGAQYAGGVGLRKFLEENKDEVNDATFVVLDGVGAGDLSLIDKSGCFKKCVTPARQKRFARTAARNLGFNLKNKPYLPIDGIECFLSKKKVIHIAGMGEDLPKYLHSKDDLVDNVEDDDLMTASNFVMELLGEI